MDDKEANMEKNLTLTKESLSTPLRWPASYKLPGFDIEAMTRGTKKAPTWLHIGAGNIFRIFLAGLQQDLLEAGHTDKGIIVYESYDEGIIPASFTPYDNLTLAVSLNADGSVKKRVIASVADAFHSDLSPFQKQSKQVKCPKSRKINAFGQIFLSNLRHIMLCCDVLCGII
jgi:mannitol-1-phosphate/altronate dehydrogenase